MNTKLNFLFIIIFSVSITFNYATGKNSSLNKGIEKENGYENTKIYTVFMSPGGHFGTGGAPESLTTNQELLLQIKTKCGGIDFIARDITNPDISVKNVYHELDSLKEYIDGVLIIGELHGEYKLAFTGLPTIYVYNLFEWMNVPHKLFSTGKEEESILVGDTEYQKGKILTAELDRRNVCSSSVREKMFEDLIYKIKLIQTIRKLKESRILVVAPQQYIAQVDYQGDRQKAFPKDYNNLYTNTLKDKLGVELVQVNPEEFYKTYEETSKNEAEKVAEKWIEEAQSVTAAKSEIIRTAKAYLAFETLRKKYNCNAVSTHMRSLTGSGKVNDRFWPGLGLECGFKTRGIQAICQNYPNILVTQLLGYFLTGRPSMLGDLMIDTRNSVAILTHCGAPINPYGENGNRIPYKITTHAESPLRDTQDPGSATGLHIEWPVGEPVTFWKVYVMHNKIEVFTGKTVDGHQLYKNLDDIMCRTKLIARIEAKPVQQHFSPDEYGIHRTATLGDLREKIKDLSILIGFDVMETDK